MDQGRERARRATLRLRTHVARRLLYRTTRSSPRGRQETRPAHSPLVRAEQGSDETARMTTHTKNQDRRDSERNQPC
ncbi:hypothetical protein ACFPRL_36380 [Pseudoclavibacter helvolus]